MRHNPLAIDPTRVSDGNQIHPQDMALAKTIAEQLNKHYPGHAWAVEADHRQGIVRIRNLLISTVFGYILKIGKFANYANLEQEAVRMGGELLERANLTRGALNEAELLNGVVLDKTGRVG